MESLATQTLIIFAIRSRRVPSSAAGPVSCLTLAAFAVVALGVALTVPPLARQLGFMTLLWQFFTALVLFTIAYLVLVEMMRTVSLGRSDAPCRTLHRTRGREHRIHRRAARFSHASRIAQRAGPVTHVSPRILGARPPSPRDDDPSPCRFRRKVGGGVGRRPCAFVWLAQTRRRARLRGKSLPQLSVQFYELGLGSTTACATTLVARAARAAGAVGPAMLALSMSSSRRSMRREICLRRHVVNTEIVECFKCWVVKRHCRQLLRL